MTPLVEPRLVIVAWALRVVITFVAAWTAHKNPAHPPDADGLDVTA